MEDLPLGFGMALAQRSEAMQRFCALTDEEQRMVIDHTHQAGDASLCRPLGQPFRTGLTAPIPIHFIDWHTANYKKGRTSETLYPIFFYFGWDQ